MAESNGILISRKDYDALKYNDALCGFLTEAIKNAAKLNYSGNGLYFEDTMLDEMFRLLCPVSYMETLTRLQADKEMEGRSE